MPMVKSFTHEQWDAAARQLDALPEKPAHELRVNVRDAMKSIRSQIIDARKKGYTQEEIVQQIARNQCGHVAICNAACSERGRVCTDGKARRDKYWRGIASRKESQSGEVIADRRRTHRIIKQEGLGNKQGEIHVGKRLPRISDQAGCRNL